MKKLILFGLVLVLFSGCMTKNQWQRKYPMPEPTVNTVIKETVVYRDTIIYVQIPADTVFKTDTVSVDLKTGLINYPLQRLDVEYAYSTVSIINSRLQHHLFQKEAKIEQTIKDALKDAQTVTEIIIKEPYPVYFEPSWWQQTLMKMGYAFMILVLGGGVLLIWKFKKPF
jgi:hypothetical protein